MRKKLLTFLCCLGAMFILSIQVKAQSRLIHYWSFNTYTTINDTTASPGCSTSILNNYNPIPGLTEDYSIYGTTNAKVYFQRLPGVTTAWPSILGEGTGLSDPEGVCYTFMDETTGSTANAQLSAPAGVCIRPRNPTDSMGLLVYMPTTNYQDIAFSLAVENSSATTVRYCVFDYSVDSGVTWGRTGISEVSYLTTGAFTTTTVTFTDPAANNNPKLVLRIRDSLNATTSTGNIRYDNFAVMGDTLLPTGQYSTLIYFWDFNAFSTTAATSWGYSASGTLRTFENFPSIAPDYFIHDSSKVKLTYGLDPHITPADPRDSLYYCDIVTGLLAITPDFDTINSNWTSVPVLGTVPALNGFRMRNPDDSSYMYLYMPTKNYKNIVLNFGTESSSTGSGDSVQQYSYSVDSGSTWQISGFTEPLDSAYLPYMGTTPYFRKITIAFTDPAANNSSKLVFRVHLVGKNTGTSGNNRFDNISVQGDSIIMPLPTITTTPATYGPYCATAASPISVGFTSTGTITGPYAVQITNANGSFPTNTTSNIIGTGTTSPISAVIPAGVYPAGSVYRVRVVNSYPIVYGSDNGSNFAMAGAAGPISGPTSVCNGYSVTLTESSGGVWSSGTTAVATIGTSGIVTGASAGTSIITFNESGCLATTTIVVNPLPGTIGGTFSVCPGTSATLTDGSGGTWSSNATGIATVGSTTGMVSGVSAGTTLISYTFPTGCFMYQSVTVNPLPSVITGTNVVCQGLSTTLNDVTPGGNWSSSNTSQATVGTTGVVNGLTAGFPVISYTLPTGCMVTTTVTVNPKPSAILGNSFGCIGTTTALTDLTAFGAWSSSNTAIATVGSSTGVVTGVASGSTVISYTLSTGCLITQTMAINSLPSGITGTTTFCAGTGTTLTDITPGGTWSSSNTSIASASGGTTATVTSILGAGGNPVITYNMPTGCSASITLSVNPAPAAISGSSVVYCVGDSTTLSDLGGGTWASSNTSVAIIGSSTGVVKNVSPGLSTISYTLPDGCYTTIVEEMNSSAAPITGNTNLCNGSTYNYTDETAFGLWTSSNGSIATIGSGDGIITATGTGTAIITYGLSLSCSTTTTITVNPLPSSIMGTTSVCQGLSVTLSDVGSGSWSASDGYLASVGSGSGIVTGLVPSELNITYTLPTGCATFTTFTVNPVPATITGTTNVCVGLMTTLFETTTGGSWVSGNVAYGSVDPVAGVVTGISAGVPVISYILPTGCLASIPVTVNPLPNPIGGTTSVCMGSTTTLTDISTGGSWTSNNLSLATVSTGTDGSGEVSGVLTGMPLITYTLPTGCIMTTTVTVNPSYAISGTTTFCTGLSNTLTDFVTGGTWTSSNLSVATIGSSSGVLNSLIPGNSTITYLNTYGCSQSENITVISLPAPIAGTTSICKGFSTTLSDISGGGAGGWFSSNPSVATIGYATGVVNGLTAGSTIITYTLGTSCINTTVVTINPLPSMIAGIAPVCQSSQITLSDTLTGGTWMSENTAVATIGTSSGVVTGMGQGNATIVYTLPTGCIMTNTVIVNPILPIGGLTNVCQGLSITLTDGVPGGSWSSSNNSNATVGSTSGMVAGLLTGNTVIAYTMPVTGCFATSTVTVNPRAANTGTFNVCAGLTTTLGNINTGGTWTSTNNAISTVNPSSGTVSGIAAGNDTIMYTLATGCVSSTMFTVNPLPYAIGGLSSLCVGLNYTFTDAGSGTWESTNTAVASIGSSSGMANALTTGTTTLIYTLPTGCLTTITETVYSTPEPITGLSDVCVGGSIVYSDTGSGTWSSSNTMVATVGSTGITTGLSAGVAVISYVLPTGCLATEILTVDAVAAITGSTAVCTGLSTSLADPVPSGTWSSSDPAVATVVSGTGVVSGVHAGSDSIIYTLPTGCTTWVSFTVNASPAIYSVSGGGSYCSGTTGLMINLGGSQTGIKYQLYDTTVSGSPVTGTGSPLSFGPETAAGRYSVVATDTTSSCISDMTGSALITIIPSVTPSVSISNGIGDTVCMDQLITYTATPTNGGSSPVYLWILNSFNTSVYVDVYHIYPNSGDIIKVYMMSNALCASPDTVSQTVVVHVDSTYAPVVSITARPGFNIKPGESDTLKAVTVGAGPSPRYQWYDNGVAITGATTSTLVSSTLGNNDSVTCVVTGSGLCGVAESASVKMNVSNLSVVNLNSNGSFSLYPNPNKGAFTLKGNLGTTSDQEVTIEVTDMLGQVVYKNKVNTVNGILDEQIHLANVANGMYILNLNAGAAGAVFHFVIGE